MRVPQVAFPLLTAACCLAGHLGWAQRMAVAPLAPLPPVVRPASPNALLESVQTGVVGPHYLPVSPAAEPSARRIWPWPICLLNSRIIVNLDVVKPDDIANLHIYKGMDAPVQWRSLTENGIIDITLKSGAKLKLKTKSLSAIRRQVKVSGLVSFQLNGLRLEDSSLRVATAAIAGLDVLRNDSETIINIRLASPKPAPPRHDPPGTIYIRGVATQ